MWPVFTDKLPSLPTDAFESPPGSPTCLTFQRVRGDPGAL